MVDVAGGNSLLLLSKLGMVQGEMTLSIQHENGLWSKWQVLLQGAPLLLCLHFCSLKHASSNLLISPPILLSCCLLITPEQKHRHSSALRLSR